MPTLIDQLLEAAPADTSEMDQDLSMMAEQTQNSEDQMYLDMIPDVIFGQSELAAYTKALNSAGQLFDVEEDVAVSEDGTLTVPHMRVMLMVQAAAQEAAELGEVDPGQVPEIPMDDRGMDIEAGKLMSLTKSQAFKRFLREPPTPEPEPELEVTELDMEL